MSLRTDERQWMIYDEETQGAVIRGIEAWALMIAGTRLRKNNRLNDRIKAMNAIGAFMQKVAGQRIVEMKKNGGAQEAVADWIVLTSKWVAGKTPYTPDVARALDEIYAVIFKLDSRANGVGMNGGGVIREAIRGD